MNTAGRMLSFGGGWPTGALAGGIVSEAYGPRGAIASIGLIVVVAVVAWLSPLRGIDAESPQTKGLVPAKYALEIR